MTYGFIKVAAACPEINVADVGSNVKKCIECANHADGLGVKVLVFPELCLTGASCGDLFLSDKLLKASLDGLKKYVNSTFASDMISIIGLPLVCSGKIYNCAVVVQSGQILGIVPKANIPSAQTRYFTSAPELNFSYNFEDGITMLGKKQVFVCRNISELKFGVEIGEDRCAVFSPSSELCASGANIIFNPSASVLFSGNEKKVQTQVCGVSDRLVCGYVYAGGCKGDSTTDGVYSTQGLVAEVGEVLAENKSFTSEITACEIDVEKIAHIRRSNNIFPARCEQEYFEIEFDISECETTLTRKIKANPFMPCECVRTERFEEMLDIQAHALAKRVVAAHSKKIVLGISGGLDSTLALIVMVRAIKLLGRPVSDIIAVTMPCFGTTKRTKDNATVMCEELGVDFRCVDIKRAVEVHLEDIGHSLEDTNVVYENAQARERTQVIMDISNKVGGFVVGTGDLSELALGWATYNGDHMSMYSVNGSVPKTLVKELVRYSAEICENEVLANCFLDVVGTPVSPELLPSDKAGNIAQKTEDLVGPYEIHDFYIYNTVKYGFSPAKLYRMAQYALGDKYDDETLKKWLKVFARRFFTQQFKRSCLPDGPQVTEISLSPRGGWTMPSDAVANAWLEEIEEL